MLLLTLLIYQALHLLLLNLPLLTLVPDQLPLLLYKQRLLLLTLLTYLLALLRKLRVPVRYLRGPLGDGWR